MRVLLGLTVRLRHQMAQLGAADLQEGRDRGLVNAQLSGDLGMGATAIGEPERAGVAVSESIECPVPVHRRRTLPTPSRRVVSRRLLQVLSSLTLARLLVGEHRSHVVRARSGPDRS